MTLVRDGRVTQSHCPYCSLQCGIHLTSRADGVLDLSGREGFPVNRGGLCMKGASAAELIDHPDRITGPLARARRSAPLEPVSWDDALGRVVTAIRSAQSAHGRDAVGCFGGGGLTNEKAYQLGKFARVALGTAKLAHRHLQPIPGTDLALANGLLHIAIRDGLVDEHYVAARTTGFDAVRRAVRADWPDRTERVTGIAVADLVATVHALAGARAAMIPSARGAEQHADGTATATAWINLALALGLPGRRGSGWATVTGQGNGQGGREHGLKADQLPGYRKLADPADRAHVAAVWGIDPTDLPRPGISAYEMLDRMGTDGGVRVLLLGASNPVVSAPNALRVAERMGGVRPPLRHRLLPLRVRRLADVLLPTTQFAEEDGTLTNLEGRRRHPPQRHRAARRPLPLPAHHRPLAHELPRGRRPGAARPWPRPSRGSTRRSTPSWPDRSGSRTATRSGSPRAAPVWSSWPD